MAYYSLNVISLSLNINKGSFFAIPKEDVGDKRNERV